MPLWIHRTTKQVLRSIAPADLPEDRANYIEEPDLSAVDGVDRKYWKIVNDVPVVMTQAERDAVDAAELDAQRISKTAVFDDTEDLIRAVALTLFSEINTLRVAAGLSERTPAQLKNAVLNKLGS